MKLKLTFTKIHQKLLRKLAYKPPKFYKKMTMAAIYLSFAVVVMELIFFRYTHSPTQLIIAAINAACMVFNFKNYQGQLKHEKIMLLSATAKSETEVEEWLRLMGVTPEVVWEDLVQSYVKSRAEERRRLN